MVVDGPRLGSVPDRKAQATFLSGVISGARTGADLVSWAKATSHARTRAAIKVNTGADLFFSESAKDLRRVNNFQPDF